MQTKVRSNAFDAAHAAGINTRAKLRQFLENAGLMKTYIQNEANISTKMITILLIHFADYRMK